MLPIAAILAGILTTVVIRYTTSAGELRENRNRIYARLLEFRLFFDEPRLIWRAQLGLLHANARLVKLLLVPSLILALPMTWLTWELDAVYGRRPLRPGEPVVITVQLTRPLETTDRFALRGSTGILVETPPLRMFDDHQVTWRVRPLGDTQGKLFLTINERPTLEQPLTPRHRRSRKTDPDIAWLEVQYPDASRWWIVWFGAVATAAALLAARWV